MLNLDTHILLHALGGRLTPGERAVLSRDSWSISAIVLWEICKLRQQGRIQLDPDDGDVRRALARVHTWPLSWEVCRESCGLDIAGDPADELIAATSVVHGVPLVTRDRRLLRSKRIPLAKS